jgi:hypothetical protein
MEVANSPAYYDTATITTVESFIVSASSLTVTVITIFDQKKIYLVIQCSNFNWKLANSFFENVKLLLSLTFCTIIGEGQAGI